MSEEELIKEISKKEIEEGFYNFKIGNLSVYSFVRESIRNRYLKTNGAAILEPRNGLRSPWIAIKSMFMSIRHVLRLLVLKHNYYLVFYSFPRVEKIDGYFIDKFIDPLIEEAELNNYIIFDHGRGGQHFYPRLHQSKIIYLDFLSIMAKVGTSLFGLLFYLKNRNIFNQLIISIYNSLGDINVNKESVYKEFFSRYLYTRFLSFFLNRIHARVVVGPARDYLKPMIVAARYHNIKVCELQHGITFNETALYSGYRDPQIVPDVFLAFGDNNPKEVYGIEEDKMVNIGFAMLSMINRKNKNCTAANNNVLVISDPGITDQMLEVVASLAANYKDILFFFRPHPMELISPKHLDLIDKTPNLTLQDRTVNILEVFADFEYVIGDSSTVLYEALSFNKRVGRLKMKGLTPLYLKESDKEMFWEISNMEDFASFMNPQNKKNKGMSIYSPFDGDLFKATVGLA